MSPGAKRLRALRAGVESHSDAAGKRGGVAEISERNYL